MDNGDNTNKNDGISQEIFGIIPPNPADLHNNQVYNPYPSLDCVDNIDLDNYNLLESKESLKHTKILNMNVQNPDNFNIHLSIMDGMINNTLKKKKNSFTLFSSNSNLIGTVQLSQLRASIKPIIQSNTQELEFLQVQLLPYTTSKDYNNFLQQNDDENLYQKIKIFLYNMDYFSTSKISESISYFVDVNTFYNKLCYKFFSKGTGLNLMQMKNHIYCWRKVRGDGNCFYRSIIFRYLEILILNEQIDLLKDFTIDMYNSFQGELSKMLKITPYISINPHKVNLIMKLIISELESHNRDKAYQVFLKAINMEHKLFDLGLILYFRYMLKRYIKENENKLYLKEFDIQIGNLLPIEYETDDGKFLFDNFYEKYLLKMFIFAEKIVIYLTPFVLGMNVDVLLYEDKDDPLKKMKNSLNDTKLINDPKKQFLNNQRIYVLNFNHHYDLIYSKKEFEEVMKYADNNIVYGENIMVNKYNKEKNILNNKEHLNNNKSKQEGINKNEGKTENTNKPNQTKNSPLKKNINCGNNNQNINQKEINLHQNISKQNEHKEKEISYPISKEQNSKLAQTEQINNCPRFTNMNECWAIMDNKLNKNPNVQNKNQKFDNVQNQPCQNNSNVIKSPRPINKVNLENVSEQTIKILESQNFNKQMNNQQHYEHIMLKEHMKNIDSIKKLKEEFIKNKKLDIKERLNFLKRSYKSNLTKYSKDYSLSEKELLSCYLSNQGNVCAVCNMEIGVNQKNESRKLPCGCNVCNKSCLNQFCDKFFLEILTCSCFKKYVPKSLEKLKAMLEKYLPSNPHIKYLEEKITNAFETTCCYCKDQKNQNELNSYNLYFYHEKSNPKCTETLENFQLLSKNIKKHKLCNNCINNLFSKCFFNCRLCEENHSFHKIE